MRAPDQLFDALDALQEIEHRLHIQFRFFDVRQVRVLLQKLPFRKREPRLH